MGGKLTDEDEEAVLSELESLIAEDIPSPLQNEPEPVSDEELELPEIPSDQLPGMAYKLLLFYSKKPPHYCLSKVPKSSLFLSFH